MVKYFSLNNKKWSNLPNIKLSIQSLGNISSALKAHSKMKNVRNGPVHPFSLQDQKDVNRQAIQLLKKF